MKRIMIVLVMLVVIGSAGVVYACSSCGCRASKGHDKDHGDHVHGASSDAKSAKKAVAPVNVGNKVCPIMGVAVNKDSATKVEYKGKVYNLCCAGCKKAFLKDPEAAIKKLSKDEAVDK